MREILFRAWNISENRYVYPKNGWYDRAFMGANGYYQTVRLTVLLKSDKVICEQYTGLKDENGTKIFEGDTVRDDEKFHYDVYWCKKHLMWMIDGESLGDFSEIDLEIIGNIHEGEK